MKYAICNEMFQDWPLEKAFALAREVGYTGIEIAPFTLGSDAYQISSDRRAEVREIAASSGLEVVGLHWLLAKTEGYYLTSPDSAVQRKTTDYFCELARLCRDLGGDIMVLGSPQQRNLLPGVTREQAMSIAAEVIRGAVPTFAETGVTLALEPLGPAEGDFLRTADEGSVLMQAIDSPHVQLHLDVKAMSTESKSIPEIIREQADRVVHFHANDPNLLGPGMGEIGFTPIFDALKAIHYDRWISVEVFDYSPGVEKIATESMQNMRQAAGE